MMENYYQEFNLNPDATSEELCQELYKQKRKWITRQNAADLEKRQLAEKKASLIEEAIKIFSDPVKKNSYDLKVLRRNAPQEAPQYQQSQPQPTSRPFEYNTNYTNEQVVHEVINIYESGNSEMTIQRCLYFIQKGYRLLEVYYYLGKTYWETNQIDEAVKAFQTGINLSDTDNDSYIYGDLGNIYLITLKNPVEAKKYIDKALEIEPNNSYFQTLDNLRLIYSGNPQQAQQNILKHLTDNPNDIEYRNQSAEAYLTCSDAFFKNSNNGGSYIDSKQSYDGVLYWRRQANDIAHSERTEQLLKNWEEYGKKKFNKDNLYGIITLGIISLFFGPLCIIGFLIDAALLYFSFQAGWEIDKMQLTGQRDIANMICRGIYVVASSVAQVILKVIQILS